MEIQKGFDPAPVAITNRNASALNFTSPSLPMLQAQVSLNFDNEVNEFQVSEYLLFIYVILSFLGFFNLDQCGIVETCSMVDNLLGKLIFYGN